jgi:hypothetical protein
VLLTSGFPDAKFNGSREAPSAAATRQFLIKPYRKEDLARAIADAFASAG